ncbi:hypothetical protein P280DRAFT_510573 [Massarina eburnea CBS 473.64]|uniref:F-box domain-containing protein n=1 Tax=Massarina eburnea CBS 473.64 TaxID=1395130 RepID=A0A6A6RL81_9PLEO|nr:hypothetical protein P280DRAFT_510573 [Massarina eburnea CBS 473.64]
MTSPPQLPNEILEAIFYYAQPRDLVHIVQACSSFKSMGEKYLYRWVTLPAQIPPWPHWPSKYHLRSHTTVYFLRSLRENPELASKVWHVQLDCIWSKYTRNATGIRKVLRKLPELRSVLVNIQDHCDGDKNREDFSYHGPHSLYPGELLPAYMDLRSLLLRAHIRNANNLVISNSGGTKLVRQPSTVYVNSKCILAILTTLRWTNVEEFFAGYDLSSTDHSTIPTLLPNGRMLTPIPDQNVLGVDALLVFREFGGMPILPNLKTMDFGNLGLSTLILGRLLLHTPNVSDLTVRVNDEVWSATHIIGALQPIHRVLQRLTILELPGPYIHGDRSSNGTQADFSAFTNLQHIRVAAGLFLTRASRTDAAHYYPATDIWTSLNNGNNIPCLLPLGVQTLQLDFSIPRAIYGNEGFWSDLPNKTVLSTHSYKWIRDVICNLTLFPCLRSIALIECDLDGGEGSFDGRLPNALQSVLREKGISLKVTTRE